MFPEPESCPPRHFHRQLASALLALVVSLNLNAQPATAPVVNVLVDNSLIAAQGQPQIYLFKGGRKFYIEAYKWIEENSYNTPVNTLNPAVVAAIPSGQNLRPGDPVPGTAAALDKHLVSGPDTKVWAIFGGERHWIFSGKSLQLEPYSRFSFVTVSPEELERIPIGGDILYTDTQTAVAITCIACAFFALIFVSTDIRVRRLLDRARVTKPLLAKFFSGKNLTLRCVLFIIFALAAGLREPNLLTHPRFWAEEGSTWFQFATTHSVFKTLLMVYDKSSYLNFTANVGAVLSSATARFLGLAYAPYTTTYLAYFIQSLPLALIIFGRSRLFDCLWKVVLGCSIVVFACTASHEIWLNTINSMSFLGLITFLLAFEETWTWPGWLKWISRSTLAVCGLSSPYAIVLFPIFVIIYWREKMREQKIQCVILLLCLFIQGTVVVQTQRHVRETIAVTPEGDYFVRGTRSQFDRASIITFLGQMVSASAGPDFREDLIGQLDLKTAWMWASGQSASGQAMEKPPVITAGWLCFVLAVATLLVLKSPRLYSLTNLVLASFIIFTVFTAAGSLGGIALGRYAFLPGATFMFLLLLNCQRTDSSPLRLICAAILSLGLAVGIVDYWTIKGPTGPAWQQEVLAWNKNHAYPLHVWPQIWVKTITYKAHGHQ